MYSEHFGIKEEPFSLTPNTKYFFCQGQYRDAYNVLLVSLRTGEGFVKITGEVGSGKTLLCRKVLNSLGPNHVSAFIPNPYLTPAALHIALAEELGIPCDRFMDTNKLLNIITKKLIDLNRSGQRIIIFLDEAQALPNESLEALRLLTNLETETYKLLQVVMFGQPELDQRLATPATRQLMQRIAFSYQLNLLTYAEVEAYIRYRLQISGYTEEDLFTPAPLKTIYRYTKGTPRLINILCHKAMLSAFGANEQQINKRHVLLAANDTESLLPQKPIRKFKRWISRARPLYKSAAL